MVEKLEKVEKMISMLKKQFPTALAKFLGVILILGAAPQAYGQSFEQVAPGASHICALDVSGQTECTTCLLYTSPSPRDATLSRMPSSA